MGNTVLKIILTNDDGIDAPGLKTLVRCVRDAGDLIMAAPAEAQSGVGHRVTVREPIRVDEIKTNVYRVEGTPADCSRIALKQLAPDADMLIAGINPGANLGSDIYNSGTVAAAREAAILGCPAIAISQYIARDQQIIWDITGDHARPVLNMLLKRKLPRAHFWNVNLPHPLSKGTDSAFQFCGLDTNPHHYEYVKTGDEYTYSGSIHERPRDSGTDVAVCFDEGKVAITQIGVGTPGLS
jgi:5'-nucleotidase